jgi:hypothetical protein
VFDTVVAAERAVRRPRRPRALDFATDGSPALVDLLDNVLTKGLVVTGDIVLGLAGIDLIYLRLSALLCAADRVLETGPPARRGHAGRRRGALPLRGAR